MGSWSKLLLSDTQLHAWKRFSKSENNPLLTKLTEVQINCLEQVVEISKAYGVDSVEHGGDVFQQRGLLPVVAVNIAEKFFNRSFGVPFYCTGGNHDELDDENYNEYGDALNFLKPQVHTQDKCKVFRINYWDQVDYDAVKGYDLVIIHKEPLGAIDKKYECRKGVDWQRLAAQNRLVVFGHIHTRQKLSNNCFVLGNTWQLSFDEDTDKGVWVLQCADEKTVFDQPIEPKEIHVIDDNMRLLFFPLDFPKFIKVKTAEELPATKEELNNNFYMVTEASVNSNEGNVISVAKPQVYNQEIKSDNLQDVLKEWLTVQQKPTDWIDSVQHLVSDLSRYETPILDAKLESVSLTNFLSYDDCFFEFVDGVLVFWGKNGTFGDANGVGKSSLCEAVLWCFFNEITKENSTKEDLIRNKPEPQKMAQVRCTLRKNDGSGGFVVERCTARGLSIWETDVDGNIKLDKDGKELNLVGHMKQSRTGGERQDFLQNQILGFDAKFFQASCYFSQENLRMLTSMSNADTTNMVLSLLGFQQYEELFSKVAEKIKEVENVKIAVDKEIDISNVLLGNNKTQLEAKQEELKNTASKDAGNTLAVDIKVLEEQIATIETELQKFNNIEEAEPVKPTTEFFVPEAYVPPVIYQEKETAIADNLLMIDARLKSIMDEQLVVIAKEKELTNKIALKTGEISAVTRSISIEQSKIDKLKNQQVGVFCSVCGGEVTAESAQACIAQMIGAIQELESKKVTLNNELQGLEKLLAEAVALRKELDERINKGQLRRKTEEEDLALVKKEQNDDRVAFAQQQQALLQTKVAKDQIILAEYQKRLAVYNELKRDNLIAKQELMQTKTAKQYLIESKQNEAKQNIKVLEKINQELQTLQNENSRITKALEVSLGKNSETVNVLERYNFWKNAFSIKGIRASLMSNFCNSFNGILSEYVANIAGGIFSVAMKPQKELASGEIRNELNLIITLDGREQKYSMYSGGEKRRADIALCLALNKWISIKHNLKCGVLGLLMLDELFSSLDGVGEETTALVLQKEGLTKSVIVISHTPQLKSYSTKTYRFSKENHITKIEETGGKDE